MIFNTVIKELMSNFPEFEEVAENEFEYWRQESPPPHVFFANVLDTYLVKEMADIKNVKLVEQIFDFLEKMAISEDEKVQEILGVTILEYLGNDKRILKKARTFMRPHTLKMSYEIEKGLGRE